MRITTGVRTAKRMTIKGKYPLLNAAHAQSYMDFDTSETDSKTDVVLFNHDASVYAQEWDKRDEQIVHYAVEQERLRFAN